MVLSTRQCVPTRMLHLIRTLVAIHDIIRICKKFTYKIIVFVIGPIHFAPISCCHLSHLHKGAWIFRVTRVRCSKARRTCGRSRSTSGSRTDIPLHEDSCRTVLPLHLSGCTFGAPVPFWQCSGQWVQCAANSTLSAFLLVQSGQMVCCSLQCHPYRPTALASHPASPVPVSSRCIGNRSSWVPGIDTSAESRDSFWRVPVSRVSFFPWLHLINFKCALATSWFIKW